jgi:hypothetical protein
MKDLPNLEKFKDLLATSGEILIATGQNSNFDTLASSLAFYLSLSRMGKRVTIVSSKEPLVEEASLVGINKISSSLGGKKLIISVKDALGSVEKVTHYLDGDKLNIVVHPLVDAGQVSQDKIEFSYSKPHFDLIILFEVPELTLLEKLYTQEKDMYSETQIVVIGKTHPTDNIGELAVIDPFLSISEITSLLIAKLKMPIDKDTGSNLFYGIRSATNGFEIPPATAETFELASFCLKAGGYPQLEFKKTPSISSSQPPTVISTNQPIEPSIEENKKGVELEDVEPEPDWLAPKIYKSSKDLS